MDASELLSFSSASSFRNVTQNIYSSAVITVPMTTVAKTLKSIDSIKHWGVNGGLIGCCVMENLIPPTEDGAVRRCTLRAPPYRDRILREKLTASVEHRHCVEADLDSPASTTGEPRSVELTVEYVPCESSERHRGVFDAAVEEAIRRIRTTIRVSTATHSPHRCFVEMETECVVAVHHGRHVTSAQRLQDRSCQHALTTFWRFYLDAQMVALEQQVLKEVFPDVRTRVEENFREAFAQHEELLCTWATQTEAMLPRHAAVEELESVLVWWSRVMDAYKHQKMLVDVTEAWAERAARPSFDLTRPLLRCPTDLEKSNNRLGTTANTSVDQSVTDLNGNDLSGTTQPSQTRTDRPTTSTAAADVVGRSPHRFLPAVPLALRGPAAVGGGGNGGGRGEEGRQSVQLPRDRRHTAVPTRGSVAGPAPSESGFLLSASPVAAHAAAGAGAFSSASGSGGGGAAGTGKALSPTSSLAVSPNYAGTGSTTSNAFLSSTPSPSGRRRPPSTTQSHLLQHAQRRASNGMHLHSSVTRHNAAAAGPWRGGEATGVFFSQFFTTPSYAACGGALPSSAATQTRPEAAFPTAVGVAASPHGSSTTATASMMAAAAAADGLDVFQPAMVRQLFTLTGVLREDVARRVFALLARHDGDGAQPRLTAEGLASVLRYLDPCGVRKGGSLSRGGAAACDEAYRAEVQRCYWEQGTAPLAAADTAGSGNDSVAHAEQTSTLRELTARRAETQREGEEAALQKMVRSILSRFGIHKKSELTNEEFQMALLYISRT